MINALTIDVEDYWSVIARDRCHLPEAQPTEAVVRNTHWFLEALDQADTKATFFILGEVAQAFPLLVRQIHQQGHEIGVHGFLHRQVFKLTPDQFRREVQDCKKLLEDLTAASVAGHRAPAFSINPDTQWAFDVLCEAGFEYDSSVFPITGRRYGWPGFSKDICRVQTPAKNAIIEVPMTVWTVLKKNLPAAGGGYLRHFPYWLTQRAMQRIQRDRPVIVYLHPYEIEENPGPLNLKHLAAKDRPKTIRFHRIQARNRRTVKQKFFRLLDDFRFTSLIEVIKQQPSLSVINLKSVCP